MAVAFVGGFGKINTEAVNPITVTTPGDLASSETLVSFVVSSSARLPVTPPSGWTFLTSVLNASGSSNAVGIEIYARSASGMPASQDWLFGAGSSYNKVYIRRYSGAVVPTLAAATSASVADVTSKAAPSLEAPSAGILVCGWAQDNLDTEASTVPASMGNKVDFYGSDIGLFSADESVTGGTTGTRLGSVPTNSNDMAAVSVFVPRAGPSVSAGPDVAGAVNQALFLNGTVTGTGTITYLWEQVGGDGELTIYSPTEVDTFVASTATPGVFTARLTATDDNGSASDEATVTVTEPPPPPVAGFPILVVEIDSSTAPNAWQPPAEWTRIDTTNGVRGVSVRRGQHETYGPAEPGEMVLTLRNANGYLDPTFPGSPYVGLLTPGRQLRVRSGSVEVFRGNVAAWPVSWRLNGQDSETTLIVTDVLAELGRTMLPQTLFEHEARRGVFPEPTHFWPMAENALSEGTVAADVFGDLDYPLFPSQTAPGGQLAPYSRLEGVAGPITAGGTQFTRMPIPDVYTDWTVMALVRPPSVPEPVDVGSTTYFPNAFPLIILPTGSTLAPVRAGFVMEFGVGEYKLYLSHNTGTFDETYGADDMGSSTAYTMFVTHVAATKQLTVRAIRHSDGFVFTVTDNYSGTLGAFNGSCDLVTAYGWQGSATAHVAIWSEALSTTVQNVVHFTIRLPWAGDDVSARVANLFDAAVPGAPTVVDSSTAAMLPATLAAPALDVIRRTTGPEHRLWATAAGTIVFRDRLSAAGDQVALGTGGLAVVDLALTDAHGDVVTRCLVENESGNRQEHHDTAASAARGEHRLTMDGSVLADPREMLAVAARIVNRRASPAPHVDYVTLAPGDPAVGFAVPLAMDLYSLVSIAYTRPWDGATVTQELEIIGISHTGRQGERFETTLRLRVPA